MAPTYCKRTCATSITNTSDKNKKSSSDQSKRSNNIFLGEKEVLQGEKQVPPEKPPRFNQSSSSGQSVQAGPTANVLRNEVFGQKESDFDYGHRFEDGPRRQLGNHPRARWKPSTIPPAMVLAPYDKATLDRAAKWEATHRENAKRDTTAPPQETKDR